MSSNAIMQSTDEERLAAIRHPVKADLEAIDALITTQLSSNITLIQTITRHILKSGGKRLRPLLVVLSARACGYQDGNEHIELATIIEFVHTATLLHDDVVDQSDLRRGQQTASAIWGNAASVLVGDFLYSRAFQMLTARHNLAIMQVLANTTNAIAEGEVLQLMNRHDPKLSEQKYKEVIERKTAKLFESSAEIGALLSSNHNDRKALKHYGLHLGLAFQIIDDLLDYTADTNVIGKNIGDDLSEGKITLPLIYALQHVDSQCAQYITDAIKTGTLQEFDIIKNAIVQTGADEYCIQIAAQHAQAARESLFAITSSPFRQALDELIDFAVERHF